MTVSLADVWSQNAAEVLYRANQFFREKTEYQLNVMYSLYKTHQSTEVVEQYKGKSMRLNNHFYSRVKNTEQLILDDFSLTISNEEKIILMQPELKQLLTEFDVELVKKYGERLFLETKESEYWCTIVFNEKAGITFEKLVLRIDKSTFFINGLIYYFGEYHDFSENYQTKDLSRPRLEILFYDFSLKADVPSNLFNQKTYLVKSGNTWIGQGKYEDYEIIWQ